VPNIPYGLFRSHAATYRNPWLRLWPYL